jgi:opacity protein-like surface antigen
MKTSAILKHTTLLAGTCLTLALHAQNSPSPWFFRADLGASHPMDTDLDEFLGLGPAEAEIDFDVGMRLGVAGGYRLTPWLALELESGVVFNSINDSEGDSVDASLTQVPLMANVVIQCNHFDRWVPFIGVGAGGVSSILDIDERIDVGEGTLIVEGNDADFVFGYHAFAGITYEFNERMGVGVIYRFMATQGPSWDVDSDDLSGDLEIAFDDLFTHSISALFHLDF